MEANESDDERDEGSDGTNLVENDPTWSSLMSSCNLDPRRTYSAANIPLWPASTISP